MQRLAIVSPYVSAGRRHTAAEWRVYSEGYYRALCQALRVMEHAAAARERRAVEQLEADRRRVASYADRVLRRERIRLVRNSSRGAAL